MDGIADGLQVDDIIAIALPAEFSSFFHFRYPVHVEYQGGSILFLTAHDAAHFSAVGRFLQVQPRIPTVERQTYAGQDDPGQRYGKQPVSGMICSAFFRMDRLKVAFQRYKCSGRALNA